MEKVTNEPKEKVVAVKGVERKNTTTLLLPAHTLEELMSIGLLIFALFLVALLVGYVLDIIIREQWRLRTQRMRHSMIVGDFPPTYSQIVLRKDPPEYTESVMQEINPEKNLNWSTDVEKSGLVHPEVRAAIAAKVRSHGHLLLSRYGTDVELMRRTQSEGSVPLQEENIRETINAAQSHSIFTVGGVY